jgi:hypothetical protein
MPRLLTTGVSILAVSSLVLWSFAAERSGAAKASRDRGQITVSNDRITVPKAAVAGRSKSAGQPGTTGAAVIYDNYGTGNAYDQMFSWALRNEVDGVNQLQGDPFVPTDSDYDLAAIELTAILIQGANELDVWLHDDNGGVPGNVLESFHVSNTLGDPFAVNAPIVLTSQGTRLTKGQTYWIVAQPSEPNSIAGWCLNVTGDSGAHAQSLDGVSWSTSSSTRGVFRVTGTAVSGGCPIAQAAYSVQSRLKGLISATLPTGVTGLLADLRQFRDRTLARTAEGRQLTALYYAHADELKSLLAQDPSLTLATVELVAKLLPALRTAAVRPTGTVRVEASLIAEGRQLIERYRAAAGPDLQPALKAVREFVDARTVRMSSTSAELAF